MPEDGDLVRYCGNTGIFVLFSTLMPKLVWRSHDLSKWAIIIDKDGLGSVICAAMDVRTMEDYWARILPRQDVLSECHDYKWGSVIILGKRLLKMSKTRRGRRHRNRIPHLSIPQEV